MPGTLVFRRLISADLETTRRWRNHPDSLLWFGDTQPITAEAQQRWFASRQQIGDDDIFVLVAESGRLIGQFSVYHIDHLRRCAEVGRFLVDPENRGRGYFDAGLLRLLIHCRESYALTSVYLKVRSDNHRAIRAYHRNGFVVGNDAGGMLTMTRELRA